MKPTQGSIPSGRARRAEYIALRQAGMRIADAAVAVGIYADDKTINRYEHWLKAINDGQEIIPGTPGRRAARPLAVSATEPGGAQRRGRPS